MPTNTDTHNRVCTYANQALEILIIARRHATTCPQCRIDARFCDTAQDYARNFEREFELWQGTRQSGGVRL